MDVPAGVSVECSPITGLTRRHWAATADRMLAAVEPYRSPGGAYIDLPGPVSANGRDSDRLEGFARTFLMAAFRVVGEGGADPAGLLERYARGLAAGTDPGSGEAWLRVDENRQVAVETASIALGLQLTRPWLWDRLDAGVQERVVAWMSHMIGARFAPINWVWFRIVTESFLREVGGPWSREDVEADLTVHASLRKPGGWRSDGVPVRAYDHYNAFALHFYPLLWAGAFAVDDLAGPDVRRQWGADLTRHLVDAAALIGSDGSPLLQGRSLTYRFAVAAPFWVDAMRPDPGCSPGLARRVASGILGHFLDHGAVDERGLLPIGWHGAWTGIRQSYSGPGSPYWASKGMLGLALPADHPVWTAVEEPLPVETGDVARVVTAPGWLVSARRRDGIAIVLNHGTDRELPGAEVADSPVYARLGYSTATLPPVTGRRRDDPLDNAVVLLDGDGRASHRCGFTPLLAVELPGGVLVGASSGPVRWVDITGDDRPDHGSGRGGPVTPGPVITVVSVLRDGVEVRLARVEGSGSWGALRMGGWPVAARGKAPAVRPGPGSAVTVTASGLRSRLVGLHGFVEAGAETVPDAGPFGDAGVPWLRTAPDLAPGEIVAACVVLDRVDVGGPAAPALPGLDPAASPPTVVWPDGLRTAVPAL